MHTEVNRDGHYKCLQLGAHLKETSKQGRKINKERAQRKKQEAFLDVNLVHVGMKDTYPQSAVINLTISKSFPRGKSPSQKHHHDTSGDHHVEYPAIHESPSLQRECENQTCIPIITVLGTQKLHNVYCMK